MTTNLSVAEKELVKTRRLKESHHLHPAATRTACERVENLAVPLRPARQFVALRIGKGPAGVLLGLVDHLPGLGHFDQSREAEGQRVM